MYKDDNQHLKNRLETNKAKHKNKEENKEKKESESVKNLGKKKL